MTHEETNRVFLGKVTATALTTAPVGVPAAGSGVLENVYEVDIGDVANVGEKRRGRFNVIELVVELGGGGTGVDVIPWYSRKNPAPNKYEPEATTADGDADSWCSKGGQSVLAAPSTVRGNVIQIRVNGAKFFTFQIANLAGGGGSTVTIYAYGLNDRQGGW